MRYWKCFINNFLKGTSGFCLQLVYFKNNNIKLLSLYYRVCHQFRHQSEIIIFQSLLTPFEACFIFWGSWDSIANQLEPKTLSIFSLPKVVKRTVWSSFPRIHEYVVYWHFKSDFQLHSVQPFYTKATQLPWWREQT